MGGIRDQIRHPRLALGSPGMNQEQQVAGKGRPILVCRPSNHLAWSCTIAWTRLVCVVWEGAHRGSSCRR